MQRQGETVKETMTWTRETRPAQNYTRASERHDMRLAGRLTWKNEQGATRFVSVVTTNISEQGAFVECRTPVSIPLYRLVQFQLERTGYDATRIPAPLRQGRVLSAVYRVKSATRSGAPQGLALRLLVDPRRAAADSRSEASAASA